MGLGMAFYISLALAVASECGDNDGTLVGAYSVGISISSIRQYESRINVEIDDTIVMKSKVFEMFLNQEVARHDRLFRDR